RIRHGVARDAGRNASRSERAAGGDRRGGGSRRDAVAAASASGRSPGDTLCVLGRVAGDDDRHLEGALRARIPAGEVDRGGVKRAARGELGARVMTPAAGLTTRSPPRRSDLLHRAAAAVRTPAARTAIRAFAGTRALVWLIAIYAAFPLYHRGSALSPVPARQPRARTDRREAHRLADRAVSGRPRLRRAIPGEPLPAAVRRCLLRRANRAVGGRGRARAARLRDAHRRRAPDR